MKLTAKELTRKKCAPCEGGAAKLLPVQCASYQEAVPDWQRTEDNKGIRRSWRVKDFATALDFFQRIGQIAEAEDHHPDLHLTGYRNVTVELSTHAIGGLSENDFIVAARIDELPVELKE
jgi:4a-hydroxytetrahydrobiopterin dehydratase